MVSLDLAISLGMIRRGKDMAEPFGFEIREPWLVGKKGLSRENLNPKKVP
jgi:hypothetical protein